MTQRLTIGLVGGMSWQSTALYYRRLNEAMEARRGGHRNARSVLHTLEFEPLLADGHAGRWDKVADTVADAARRAKAGGADFVVIASVTGHAVASAVAPIIGLPLLHIADAVADAARARGWTRIGLLGTRFVTEGDFMRLPLERQGISVSVADEAARSEFHRIIIDELTLGHFLPRSRKFCVAEARALHENGADGLVLGCTELPLLVEPDEVDLPVIDAVQAHVDAAVEAALSGRLPR